MSTVADCHFTERAPRAWFYTIRYRDDYSPDERGPFPTFAAALRDLDKNHANPGGFSIRALPGCPHDMLAPVPYRMGMTCDRCGAFVRGGMS